MNIVKLTWKKDGQEEKRPQHHGRNQEKSIIEQNNDGKQDDECCVSVADVVCLVTVKLLNT